MRQRSLRGGFTLIEVLIAVGVLSLIATLIFASFSSLKRSKDGIRRVSERYREGRLAMGRITRELQGAYISKHLPIDINLAQVKTAFISEGGSPADRINFNSFSNQRLNRDAKESDQLEISYFGMESEKQRGVTDLVRRADSTPDLEPTNGGRVQVLATDIDLFDLQYLDPLIGDWIEEWDSTQAVRQYDRMPLQVRVLLVLNGGSRSESAGSRQTIPFVSKVGLNMLTPLTFGVQQ